MSLTIIHAESAIARDMSHATNIDLPLESSESSPWWIIIYPAPRVINKSESTQNATIRLSMIFPSTPFTVLAEPHPLAKAVLPGVKVLTLIEKFVLLIQSEPVHSSARTWKAIVTKNTTSRTKIQKIRENSIYTVCQILEVV